MNTFKKEERLCSVKLLEQLFHNGSSFLLYPLKFTLLVSPDQRFPATVVFAVSKKRFKRAVDRNRIKRQMREAYRLQKEELLYRPLQAHQKKLLISISFVGKELLPYQLIEKKMAEGLNKIVKDHVEAAVL